VELLGRFDRQVKIRGHRIELPEIEAVLGEHPDVHAAAVVADAKGRLTAYLVAAGERAASASALREFARARLPRFMVPRAFEWITELPRSREGKLDVGALARLDAKEHVASPAGSARDDLVRRVCDLAKTALGLADVDSTRSFVELGGTSLELIRLSGLIRRHLGIVVPLVDLLEAESVEQLCLRIGTSREDTERSAAEPGPQRLELERFDVAEFGDKTAVVDRLRHWFAANPGIQLTRASTEDEAAARATSRASTRRFSLRPVRFETFGELLGVLGGFESGGGVQFRYGSVSSLYPVQTFCEVKPGRVTGLLPGLYAYHPLDHRLIECAPGARVERSAYGPQNQPIIDRAAFVLFLVCSLPDIEPIYGRFSIDLAMYEAGSMGQLLREAAPDLGLGLCSIGAMEFSSLRASLGLGDGHVFVHALAGGRLPEPGDRDALACGGTAPIDELRDLAGRLLELDDAEARLLLQALEASRS
jgi:SagB-type dehydrogenase family enzyme